MLEALGYEGGPGLAGHTLTAEQREALAPIVEAFEGEMVRAMATMRDAFFRASNAAMYMDISTPGGVFTCTATTTTLTSLSGSVRRSSGRRRGPS